MDALLNKIALLKWLPWIGKNYKTAQAVGKGLLVVAESHYDWGEEGAREDLEDWFIEYNAIREPGKAMRILRNLERALLPGNLAEVEIVRFWQLTGYYNFIQRIFEGSKQRPFGADYPNGWKTFFPLVQVLKPNYCLFAGVGASDWVYCFNEEAKANGFEVGPIKSLEPISGCYPRLSSICAPDGHSTKLIFIRHPSQYFPYKAWGDFLQLNIPEYLEWVRREIKNG
jgi:hypothetical protein